jgi:hypothetical protein
MRSGRGAEKAVHIAQIDVAVRFGTTGRSVVSV